MIYFKFQSVKNFCKLYKFYKCTLFIFMTTGGNYTTVYFIFMRKAYFSICMYTCCKSIFQKINSSIWNGSILLHHHLFYKQNYATYFKIKMLYFSFTSSLFFLLYADPREYVLVYLKKINRIMKMALLIKWSVKKNKLKKL